MPKQKHLNKRQFVKLLPVLLRRVDEAFADGFEFDHVTFRVMNCLWKGGIHFVGQLVQKVEADLFRIEGFGKKSLHEVKKHLDELGLRLGMQFTERQRELLRSCEKALEVFSTVELLPRFCEPVERFDGFFRPYAQILREAGIVYGGDLVQQGETELLSLLRQHKSFDEQGFGYSQWGLFLMGGSGLKYGVRFSEQLTRLFEAAKQYLDGSEE